MTSSSSLSRKRSNVEPTKSKNHVHKKVKLSNGKSEDANSKAALGKVLTKRKNLVEESDSGSDDEGGLGQEGDLVAGNSGEDMKTDNVNRSAGAEGCKFTAA